MNLTLPGLAGKPSKTAGAERLNSQVKIWRLAQMA